MEAGMDDHLSRPTDMKLLLSTFQKCLDLGEEQSFLEDVWAAMSPILSFYSRFFHHGCLKLHSLLMPLLNSATAGNDSGFLSQDSMQPRC